MAGLGEACSHIAALLFVLEANTKMRKNTSCTSQLCSWLPPSMQKVEYAPVSSMNFSTPSKKRKIMHDSINDGSTAAEPATSSSISKVPKPTKDELDDRYRQLESTGRRPVLLSILPGYCDKFVPQSETGVLPPTLSTLFKNEFLQLSYPELLKECEESFLSITVTQQQAKNLEEATRTQADSKTWFRYRAGRVTASKFKAAARTNKSSPSQSLIRAICYLKATNLHQKLHSGVASMKKMLVMLTLVPPRVIIPT